MKDDNTDLRPFCQHDYEAFAGVTSANPQIANSRPDQNHWVIILDGDRVALYDEEQQEHGRTFPDDCLSEEAAEMMIEDLVTGASTEAVWKAYRLTRTTQDAPTNANNWTIAERFRADTAAACMAARFAQSPVFEENLPNMAKRAVQAADALIAALARSN